jgi:uncharacterized protein YjbI with pentapeptide repeats
VKRPRIVVATALIYELAGVEAGNMTDGKRFEKQRLPEVAFVNCDLTGATFDDVGLAGATFSNVNLQKARLTNVNLSGVAIENADIEGLTIFGFDVHALIDEKLSGPKPGRG